MRTTRVFPILSQEFHTQRGFALPLTLVILLILSILSSALIFRVGGAKGDDMTNVKIHNKFHGAAHAGINRADFEMKRPDGGPKKIWSDGSSSSFDLTMDGSQVHVTIQDTKIPNPN